MSLKTNQIDPGSPYIPSQCGWDKNQIFALFSKDIDAQDKILSDPAEFSKAAQAFACVDIPSLFQQSCLQTYFVNIGAEISSGRSTQHPYAMQFLLFTVVEILKKGAWPWSLIAGKSFLGHVKDLQMLAPPELGVAKVLSDLGEPSISLFEDILKRWEQVQGMKIDYEEKIKQLNLLKESASHLEKMQFPGATAFMATLESEIRKQKALCVCAEDLYHQIRQSDLTPEQRSALLKSNLQNYNESKAFMGHLIMKNDFEMTSAYIHSLSSPQQAAQTIFRPICLEKPQNIQQAAVRELGTAIREMVFMWNLYLQSPDTVLRNEKLFTPEQQTAICELIQNKIVTLLFSYLATSEFAFDFNCASAHIGQMQSLDLLKNGKTVFLPLNTSNHQMGLLITPSSQDNASFSIYNTGGGIFKNHPNLEKKKYQTVIRKNKIPLQQIFKQELWLKLLNLRNSDDVSAVYSLLLDVIGANGVKEEPSSDFHDYESPQATGSCILQHMQAMIRDQFMQCAELGPKTTRYAIYRTIASDFSLFVGNIWTQNERNANETGMTQAWEEKKKKLQAILELASVEGNGFERLCELLDRTRNIQRSDALPEESKAFQHLEQISVLYRNQLGKRALEHLEEMPVAELPYEAVLNIERTPLKDEIFPLVKKRLAEHPPLMEKFYTILADRNTQAM